MQSTEGEFSGLVGRPYVGDWDQDWLVVRKISGAVETGRDRECTPGLVWA